MNQITIVCASALVACLSALPATALADETGTIYGRENCEQLAKRYRVAGYSARCYLTHGDKYYIYYKRLAPGEDEPTISGSLGDALGDLFR